VKSRGNSANNDKLRSRIVQPGEHIKKTARHFFSLASCIAARSF
jgi:hypothetical protein